LHFLKQKVIADFADLWLRNKTAACASALRHFILNTPVFIAFPHHFTIAPSKQCCFFGVW